MTAEQARNRAKKSIVKNLMKGIYDIIGRAADRERFSVTVPLPVEGDCIIKELRSKGFEVLVVSNTQIRIGWLKECS
jgi:hypothetical protein